MADDFVWDDVRFFLAAGRAETLTGAARLLKVSQPTVGRRLKVLEDKLGAALFERHPDRLALTDAGRALMPHAVEMERQTFDLSRALDSLRKTPDRPVRVTAIQSVAAFLARTFDRIEAACAPYAVELIGTGERLSLARQEADIALRMNAVPSRGDLVCRRIGSIAFALYASRSYAGSLDRRAALEAGRFIGYRKNPTKRSQSSWLFDFGKAGRFPLRVSDLHLRYEAVRRGIGVTILPCHLGDSSGDLTRVHPPIDDLGEEIYLLMHESRRAQPAVRQVADALVDLVRQRQDELLGQPGA